MREILFRGKSERTSDWLYGGIVHQTDFYGTQVDDYYIIDGTETQDNDIGYEVKVLPETVGQYTGLTDKNGKKIFEHDVVQTAKYGKDNGNGCNFAGKDIFQIVFEDGGYCLRNEWRRFNLRPDTDYEVIGNIHDNPAIDSPLESP